MACVLETLIQIVDEYPYDTPLHKKARLLRDVYVENSFLFENNDENYDLEIRIRDAAYEAEDILVCDGHESTDFKQVIRKIDSILEEILMLSDPVNNKDGTSNIFPVPTRLVQDDLVMGFDDDINHLIEQLTSYKQQLQIIPIVGRGGSGKTTLARKVYGHPGIAKHFDDFAWVTVSRAFDLRSALVAIISFLETTPCEMGRMSNEELSLRVYKHLMGGRYLIVLDDVHHYTAWDMLRNFFPDEKKQSRVILTTRKWSIAKYVESSGTPHQMKPIDTDASFELLRHKVVGTHEFLPPELDKIGRVIASKCQGFPLAIILIANVLSMTERRTDLWEQVEDSLFYFINKEGSRFFTDKQMLKGLAFLQSISNESSWTSSILGFEKAIIQLVNQIMSTERKLQIIPIVGRGGGGKTTLARQLYDHSSIVKSFESRAWITISQTFDLQGSLLGLLNSLLIPNKLHPGSDDDILVENVSASLKDKKYFIVVDDIWDASAWEELRVLFPDNHNGSRIILTTRKRNLADYDRSFSSSYEMQPLDEDESWRLIVRKVFGGYEHCPPELERIGRMIARNCKGLPLLVVTVAGFLSKSNQTEDAWKRVESCELFSTGEEEKIQDDSYLKVIANKLCKEGHQLLDLINKEEQKLRVVPIVGSGGRSGKKTIARLLYDQLVLSKRFDTHAWVKSSQQKEVLRNLLESLRESNVEMPRVDDDSELDEHVHKVLHKKRYVVVLDDVMDKNTWDKLSCYFQDCNNGSQIILTTREWPSNANDNIKPLILDQYWEYLLHSAFEQDSSSEETHSKVTELVPTSEKSRVSVFWDFVGQDKCIVESQGDLQSNLFSMSYNHLPYHLKPCFLYLGAFPEDYEIKVSKLINLWVAEGFVSQDKAEENLTDLIDRNLLSVSRIQHSGGSVAAVKIHDVFWKFCTEKANEENFLWFKDPEGQNTIEDGNVRRVSVPSISGDTDLAGLQSARSFLCFGRVSQDTADPMFLELKFLRVLDVLQFEFDDFPEDMLELVNLRYLGFTCRGDIPSDINTFQSLLFLIISKASSMPTELWELGNLRHIECKETRVWHHDDSFDDDFPKKNLQTLSNVPASLLSEDFLGCYPNLMKLGIFFDPEDQTFTDIDLAGLHQLESLKCFSCDKSPIMRNHLLNLTFPVSLKKLTLRSCEISVALLRTIGALQLKQLILQSCNFLDKKEATWEVAEGEFPSLLFLKMDGLNLVNWDANYDQFPFLQHLVIQRCPSMKAIPQSMKALEVIEVDTSSEKVVELVLQLKEEKEKMGMDNLLVVVHST